MSARATNIASPSRPPERSIVTAPASKARSRTATAPSAEPKSSTGERRALQADAPGDQAGGARQPEGEQQRHDVVLAVQHGDEATPRDQDRQPGGDEPEHRRRSSRQLGRPGPSGQASGGSGNQP